MNPATLLAVAVLVVGVPLNLYVTLRVRGLASAHPTVSLLRFHALVSSLVLLTVVVFGLVFLSNDLPTPIVAFEDTKLFTRTVLLALAIFPALYWIRLTGRGTRS